MQIQIFINQTLKRFFPKLALHYKAYSALIRNKCSYLYLTGWIQSLDAKKPVDKDGNPIPWMNFAVIQILKERLKDDHNLFEYGCGYSTSFFARRVKSVTSVEHSKSWYHKFKTTVPENVRLIFQENDQDGDYCRAIGCRNDLYDVVVIDGRDRVNCVKQGIRSLSAGGVILLDDSSRDRYQDGLDFAKENGFRALDIESIKPTDTIIDRTTILYRDGNCFGL